MVKKVVLFISLFEGGDDKNKVNAEINVLKQVFHKGK